MDNKKQLIIVPPMSESFQKLNEVLQGIAAEENIEISIIDDPKELIQFMGTTGQSLVAFSNAKKCATFLQENRFVIAKTHSKVILLTPKEIPAKTLIKFVKIGLTESILENSPPKTLLYKVKLLLRSIKSSSQQEDKDQFIKSMLEGGPSAAAKTDLSLDKNQSEETSVNYLGEERAKFKNDQDENAIDYGGNLKGKSTAQEEVIETHYKSKLKKQEGPLEDESEAQKINDEDSSEIDMYYRGKRKKNSDQPEEVEDDLSETKNPLSDETEGSAKKKRTPETILDLEAAEPKTRQKYQEDASDLFLKPMKDGLIIEEADGPAKLQKLMTDEEKAEIRKKEFEELDALFAEAKKRQAEQAEDLGGHLKGKILNNDNEDEDLPEINEKREYDNSELHERQKSFDLDLIASKKEKKGRRDNEVEEDEKDPHEGQVDNIDNNMVGENGSTDKINTRMMSELGEDASKKLRTKDVFDLDPSKNNENEDEEDSKDRKKNLKLVENSDKDKTPEENQEDHDNEEETEKSINLDLEPAIVDKSKKETKSEELEDDGDHKRKPASLQLEASEEDQTNSNQEEVDPHMSFKKLDQTDLGLEKDKDGKKNLGKVDKIDTYYRGGESKKTEHSWDNLNSKREVNLQVEKTKRNEEESLARQAAKDLGEITIDYRKLKEEFDQMSRGEQTTGDGILEERSQNLLDSEDEGTFKVVELDARGFDFGVNIVNLIYQKDSKPVDYFKLVAEELITKYKAYSVFYTFKPNDKKHSETFDSFMHFSTSLVSNELKEWWLNTKTQDEIMADYFSKSMATWLSREIENKSGTTGKYWEDIELPQWAANELTNKKVELIYPYFDGVDRMGVALVFFPEGLNPKTEKALTVTLEMARTILLDTIQRKSAPVERDKLNEDSPPEKKRILSMFTGLFNRNKAG